MKATLGMHPKVYKAAKSGEFHSLMTIILENGDDLFHQTTPKGNSVFHIVAQFGQVNFIQDFLQDLSRSSLLWQGNYKGDTPLHVATQVRSHQMVRVFIDRAKVLHQPYAYKELLRKPNSYKDTLLHSAIRARCKGAVELLIEEDPQLCDITNAPDESPLYLAIHRRFSDIIEPILCASSSPASHKGPKGLTALHAAVHFKLPGLSKILEKRPEVIRKGDDMGWTALHYAACFGNVKAVQLLLQYDTSVAYDLDREKESALHIAAFRGHVNIVGELISSCPDACDMINTKEQTALHAAVIGGKVKVVKHILKMANLKDLINKQDTDGNTALHLAVLHKKYNIIYILAQDKRVDHLATNKDHLTALDIFFTREEVNFATLKVYRSLKGSHGFPVIQDWVKKYVKERLDKQFVEGQPVGFITTGSNTTNREKSNSSLGSIVDSQLLVAAFIATVTFAAAFTMPGGYNSDGPNRGMATLAGRAAFQAFFIFNTIAFSCSTLALFFRYDNFFLSDSQKLKYAGAIGSHIYIAVLGMVLAFASGTYVVLTKTIGLGIVPYIVIGGLVSSYWISGVLDPEIRFGALRIHPIVAPAKSRSYYGIR